MNWYVISSCRKRARGQSYQQLLVFTPPCPPNSICLCLPGSAGDIALPFSILVREEWQPLIKAEGQFKPPYILVSLWLHFYPTSSSTSVPPKGKHIPFPLQTSFDGPDPIFSPPASESRSTNFPSCVLLFLLTESFFHLTNWLLVPFPKSKQNQIQDNITPPTPQSNLLKHLSALPHQNGGTYHHNVFIFLHLFPDLLVKAESPLPPSLSQLCITPLVSRCRRGGWTRHFNRPILLKDN